MSKKKKKQGSGGSGNEIVHGELQRKKKELDLEIQEFAQEKEEFLAQLTQREEDLSLAMAKVQAVEADVDAYVAEHRQEKLDRLAEEMQALHGEESARILALQEKQRQELAQGWHKQGEQMDRHLEERLAKTDALVEARQLELREEEKQLREKAQSLWEEEQALHRKEQDLLSSFEEKEARLQRDIQGKVRDFTYAQEEALLEQGHFQHMIQRLKEDKGRTQQAHHQQLLESQGLIREGEEKYQALWAEHQGLHQKYREFHQELGGDLQSHLNTVGELKRSKKELEKALSLSVPRQVEEDLLQLREEYSKLLQQRSQWENSLLQCDALSLQQQELSHLLALSQGEVRFHQEQTEQLQVENTNIKEQLKEMTLRYCTPSILHEDLNRRMAQITEGYTLSSPEDTFPKDMEELVWLQYILTRCATAQMEFPLRVFLAFHTAMKISDWSIVTVLAGVSGTGKSKLPELYATFGGLNFIAVPVQEHWDGQESMLGYFNSMDNRFEPQPLLRFLLSALEIPPEQKALLEKQLPPDLESGKRLYAEDGERTVSLVLLDEMNLAHVEQYFAEFLSKLEGRRGLREVPSVDVKLGTGIPDYPLKLRRNILWSGTMNQDETTKSLSDKVLDRGVVINFPRPEVFLRRESQRVQGTGAYRLPYKLWRKWICNNTLYQVAVEGLGTLENLEAKYEMIGEEGQGLSGKWVNYKLILEDINRLMTKEGRALGHRVWQATEYYVVNHPFVIYEMKHSYDPEKGECVLSSGLKSAIHLAMEDQIVQKIMPKLRGVEYYAHGTLEEIGQLLGKYFPNLFQDYQNACQQGDGQFMWVTSQYGEQLGQQWLDLLQGGEMEWMRDET